MRSVNRNRFLLLLPMVIALAPFQGRSQGNYAQTEQSTYRLYMGKEWDSLITLGHRAIRNHIDYYYLRVRMGVAYDGRNQFIRSSWQYDRALQFNSRDPFATGQRYVSLTNANRPFQARAMEPQMTREQREQMCRKTTVLSFVTLDLGYTLSNAYNKINTTDLMGPDSIYGEADLYGNDYFANLGIGFNLSDRFTLIAGYTYLNFSKRKTVEYSYFTDQLDSTAVQDWGYENYYSFPRVTRDYPIDYAIDQNEFCIGGIVALDHGVKILPVFRLVSVKYMNTTVRYSTALVMDTSYYVTATDTYYTFPFKRSHYSVSDSDTSSLNCLFSLTATRDFDLLTVGMTGSWSNLNGGDQLQASGFVTVYPLGNLNLYGTTGATMVSEQGDGRMLFSQMAGGRITRWLWAEGDFIWGDLSNSNTSNGWVVYNNSGKIRYRAGASLILTIIRNMEFTFHYQFFRKESPVYRITDGQNGTVAMQTAWKPYQSHNMFIGIQINL